MKCSEAVFDWWVRNGNIFIMDLHTRENNSKSVTNDIENVISVIAAINRGIDGMRVFYCDTDERYDEILIKNNKFNGFRLLNAKTLDEAVSSL